MSTAGSTTAHSGKLKENSPVVGRKDESNTFEINILMEGTLAAKEVNNSKPDPDPDSESEDEDYSYYGKVKVAKPDKFYKKREKLEPWLLQLCMWFWDHNTLSAEKKRSVYALSLMRGRALKWIQPLLKKFLKKDKDSEGLFKNFGKFLAKIRITFRITNDKEYAIKVIKTFRQTASASEYVARFDKYAPQTEWDNQALMEMFRDGLKLSV